MSSNETADATGRTVGLTESERHRLLAVERRRLAIEILAGEPSPTDLEALARELAAREDGRDVPEEASVEQVETTLHHAHLPALAEVGLVEYDPESHRIDPTGMLVAADGRL